MKMVCKKLLSLVLVALMLVTALPFQASAEEGYKVTIHLPNGDTKVCQIVDGKLTQEDIDAVAKAVEGTKVCGWHQQEGQSKGDKLSAWSFNGQRDYELYPVYDGGEPEPPKPEHTHEYKLDSELSKAPTCTEAGKNVYVCSSCDDSYTEDVAATGHKWGEWKVVDEATTDKEGQEKRTCGTCGEKEFREIPKLDAKTVTIKFVDTFNSKFDEVTTRTYEVGKKMSLPDAPSHGGYAFKGWYTEENGGMKLEEGTKCTEDMTGTYYARYTKDSKFPYSVYLHIYEAGNVKSPMKTVTLDTWTCVKDGVVTLGELKDVIKTYYTAKDSNGIGYDGIYWSTSSTKTDYIKDENQTDRIEDLDDLRSKGYVHLNVWIDNAKAKSDSSSSSSSSNPKTGDTIYMAVTVMGLSAASLAAVYYISKKRAVR